jgi:hypothetical protein
MRYHGPRWLLGRAGVIAVALAAGAGGFASPVLAAQTTAAAGPAATGPVSTTPATGTPELVKTSSQETIRQLVKCGTLMYAVGSFTKISQGGTTYTRNNVFSFSATAPYSVSGWDVNVNGEVHTIAFTNGHGCGYAYLGGSFTSVHGTPATNIAEVSTTTGAVVTSFGHDANGAVETMFGYGPHLLVGGRFTVTNGYSRYYYESLSPTSGKDDGFINLHVQGQILNNAREIYNQQLSHTGNLMLAEGNFTSIGGQPRQQIFMLNLNTNPASVTGWTSSEFNQNCIAKESMYVRAAAWSPDDSTIYTASTGAHPLTWKNGTLYGLCDTAAAFPSSQKSVSHTWIEYTGCDSYYSVAADNGAVYVGGHQRWAENPNGCNIAGPGAIADPGLQGLSPSNGTVETSGGTPRYSSSKANADDMLITSAGLWIASTNRFGSDVCDGVSGLAGICFLPYT